MPYLSAIQIWTKTGACDNSTGISAVVEKVRDSISNSRSISVSSGGEKPTIVAHSNDSSANVVDGDKQVTAPSVANSDVPLYTTNGDVKTTKTTQELKTSKNKGSGCRSGANSGESVLLCQYFEKQGPHARQLLIEKIDELAGLYPEAFDCRASCLDLKRSWFSVVWYPILCDHMTSSELRGAYLTYHTFETVGSCPIRRPKHSFSASAMGPSTPCTPVTPTAHDDKYESDDSVDSVSSFSSVGSTHLQMGGLFCRVLDANGDCNHCNESRKDLKTSSVGRSEPSKNLPTFDSPPLDDCKHDNCPKNQKTFLNPHQLLLEAHAALSDLGSTVPSAEESIKRNYLGILGFVLHRVREDVWYENPQYETCQCRMMDLMASYVRDSKTSASTVDMIAASMQSIFSPTIHKGPLPPPHLFLRLGLHNILPVPFIGERTPSASAVRNLPSNTSTTDGGQTRMPHVSPTTRGKHRDAAGPIVAPEAGTSTSTGSSVETDSSYPDPSKASVLPSSTSAGVASSTNSTTTSTSPPKGVPRVPAGPTAVPPPRLNIADVLPSLLQNDVIATVSPGAMTSPRGEPLPPAAGGAISRTTPVPLTRSLSANSVFSAPPGMAGCPYHGRVIHSRVEDLLAMFESATVTHPDLEHMTRGVSKKG